MPDTLIESVLTGKLDSVLLIKWINNDAIDDDSDLFCCKRNEFVVCFLSYLRHQTDSILQTNSNAAQIIQISTPEKAPSSRRKHHRSISEPTSDDRDSVSVKTEKTRESPNRDHKRPGRRVKTTLFPDDRKEAHLSVSSDESRLSTSMDRMAISSTPLKNGAKASEYPNFPLSSPVTPRSFIKDGERCDTPRLSHRHSRSHEKSCLGDFIVTATKSSKKKSKKNVSNEDEKLELDLSNSELFPEIGARKSSSLRGEKKRIKPTNIDKSQKSVSLNNFNSECFQQPSPLVLEENSAFTQQKFQPQETTNSFEVERIILKQERHKLMEKFNILNAATPLKTTTPKIKTNEKVSVEITQSYVNADVSQIMLKDKIDLLIHIYNSLHKNNLILSVVTEIYFLISIVISKQLEDDYINAENKLNDNNIEYLLRSIHNSSYFAVKSLWNLRETLEVILDKNSIKILGENKKVRSFSPELAKFLLNVYCVLSERPLPPPAPRAPAVVCYNTETDSADNFPSTQAFHNFKKQRDMFYDIVRWYQEAESAGASKSSFRARVKALTSLGASAANHSHLAGLFVAHMMGECLPAGQESKLSKLQRRLTCPAPRESNRLPNFTPDEMFYKEFILNAEHESFRMHLRDALSAEIVTLDATQFAVEDRGNSNNIHISREYLQITKKLVVLAKFLGYLTALPHSPVSVETASKNNNLTLNNYAVPKEKVLESSLLLRSYSQPSIDIKGLLQNAIDNARLSIALPWIMNYLSMLDYTTIHLPYYQDVLKTLLNIYHTKLVLKDNAMKKNTIIYLKSILGWLFDLPHCSEIESSVNSVGTDSIDTCDLVDESIFELCPCLKDVNTLLSTCRLSQEQKDIGSFRHITPVSINVDPQARIRNKEKELQSRLEEELVRSQPSSTRRVLEMVIERVTSAAVRELTARELAHARTNASEHAARVIANERGRDHAALLATVTAIYNSHLKSLRAAAADSARAALASRARAALAALLPAAPAPLHSVACRAARNRLNNWINDHWNTTAVLCKDIESEMKTLLSLNELRVPSLRTPPGHAPATLSCDESPATVLIHLKEHLCRVLEGTPSDAQEAAATLARCARACAPPSAARRPRTVQAMLHLTVDLCIVYVSKKPKEVTAPFLQKFHAIWSTCCPDRKHFSPNSESTIESGDISPELRNYTDDRLPTPISDEETESTAVNGLNQKIEENTRKIGPTTLGSNNKFNFDMETKLDASPTESIKIDKKSPKTPIPKLSPKPTQMTPLKRITPIPLSSPKTEKQPTFTINTETSKPNTRQSGPNSRQIDPNSKQSDSNSKQSDPNSRTDPNSKQSDPISRQTDPNSRQADSNSKNSDPNSRQTDPNSRQTDSNSKHSDPNSKTESKVEITYEESNDHLLEYFDRILCPRNIMILSSSRYKQSDVWEALAIMIVFLLRNDYLSEDSLTEQCLAVYRQDWSQSILEQLSGCMKAVSSEWSRSTTGKFALFLDFLAEYCGDMDYDFTT